MRHSGARATEGDWPKQIPEVFNPAPGKCPE